MFSWWNSIAVLQSLYQIIKCGIASKFITASYINREFCSAAWPGDHWMCVWRRKGKGAQPPVMLPSVLMMPSRCLTLWEQMGLLCMSAFPACCIVYYSLRARLCFNVFVYWAQWQTVWCQVSLYRHVVSALSAIIFLSCLSLVFHYCLPQEKERDQLVLMFTPVDMVDW